MDTVLSVESGWQMDYPTLILASASPRRRALLSVLGLPFQVLQADVEEERLEGESPSEMVMRLSRAKAEAVATAVRASIVLACDTVVALDEEVLGKPADPGEATSMLRRLRGREHSVYSGLTVLAADWNSPTRPSELHTACDETAVHMRCYSEAEISAYVATGDPLDKAGAYAIQSASFHPVARIEGCYASVMGLPLRLVARSLRVCGLSVPPNQSIAAACAAFTGHACCLA
jgi:septum formation protein